MTRRAARPSPKAHSPIHRNAREHERTRSRRFASCQAGSRSIIRTPCSANARIVGVGLFEVPVPCQAALDRRRASQSDRASPHVHWGIHDALSKEAKWGDNLDRPPLPVAVVLGPHPRRGAHAAVSPRQDSQQLHFFVLPTGDEQHSRPHDGTTRWIDNLVTRRTCQVGCRGGRANWTRLLRLQLRSPRQQRCDRGARLIRPSRLGCSASCLVKAEPQHEGRRQEGAYQERPRASSRSTSRVAHARGAPA